jgi:GNAT superfamily N-acetyltransferase
MRRTGLVRQTRSWGMAAREYHGRSGWGGGGHPTPGAVPAGDGLPDHPRLVPPPRVQRSVPDTCGGRGRGLRLVANEHIPETVNEFHTAPAYRHKALPMFRALLEASRANRLRAQSNDALMLLMLYDCATNITLDAVLFEDGPATHLPSPGGVLRKVTEADQDLLRERDMEWDADWMIEQNGVPVATGGALFHYNPPYADLYMAVHPEHRRQGYGSYMIQELRRICYGLGKVPAARCNVDNAASRATLQKGGLLACGRLLFGDVIR